MMMVVPCSSKKYGKGYGGIIDATTSEGFRKNTGIQIESVRWIHKNRVISTVGKVESTVLNKIDTYLLNTIPTYKKEKVRFNVINRQLYEAKKEIDKLTDEISVLKSKLES